MSLLYQIIKRCKYSLPKMSLSSSFTNPRFKTIMVHIAKKRCMSMFIRKKRHPTHLAFTYSFKKCKGRNLHKVLTRKPQNYKYHLLGLRLLISTCSICFVFILNSWAETKTLLYCIDSKSKNFFFNFHLQFYYFNRLSWFLVKEAGCSTI